MFKAFADFMIMLLVIGFLFYVLIYVVMDFPHPQWFTEGVQQELSAPRNY